MRASDESYLNDAMDALGEMLDYAVVDCGFDIDGFFDQFVASGVANAFAAGDPRYVAGMSGVDMAREACFKVTGKRPDAAPTQALDRSPEYWTGWIMAYYQWYRAARFQDMVACGLAPSAVRARFVLHEADVSTFVKEADTVMGRAIAGESRLAAARKARGFTQQQLADAAEVSLRMVQLYEQRQNDLAKASFSTVLNLARALGCAPEELLDYALGEDG